MMKMFLVAVCISIGLMLAIYRYENSGVEVGDVWVSASCKDPFVRTFEHQEVIDIQEGYVLYRYNNSITNSCRIRTLKYGSTRIKKGAITK